MHVLLLCGLALVKFSERLQSFTEITSAIEEDDPATYKFDSTVTDQIGSGGDVSSLAASQEASNQLVRSPQEEIERTVTDNLNVAAPSTEQLPQPSKSDVLASVATQGATQHSGGVEGAVDSLTWEIANSLRDKKTLVVWLFDVSPSLAARRAMIADRVENVYNQLTSLNVSSDKVLKSAVVTFGEKTNVITKDPVDDVADLVKAVRSIKSESSGNENTFAAVNFVAKHYQTYRTQMHRDVMIIIVTDEAGSDPVNLEQAIVNTKRYGMRCYCVGDAAPFGKEFTEAPFTLENGETVIGVMQRGPETFYPERVRLAYWGANGYALEDMSSGFGPYGLTRLCNESNGIYFITDDGRGRKFDPQVMRNYAPDYRPIRMLDADIGQNKAKAALIEVCRLLKIDNVPPPRLEFPAENDTVLRQAITESQKPLADFEYKLDHLVRVLEPGEKDRAKIKDARSRAGYDLAMGRVLALRARSFGYNAMLAEMKASPKKFEKEGSNQWRLVPSKEITSGATTKKLATRALDYLNRVIDDNPGTPWELMAELERNTPLGWEWKEANYNPNPAGMGGGKDKAGPKFIEVEDPVTKKKVKKQIDKDPVKRDI
ncbi:MAG: VWA domain-containing protein [Candidatus Saccharimonas sp.]|nr:VWA domain-containing protein [Planctomycetaceae bacterium]